MAEGDHSPKKISKNGPFEEIVNPHKEGFKFSEEPSLEKIRELQSIFAKERNWEQYHTPRNILLALVGEVGELAEIFQWKGEVKEGIPNFTDKERTHVGQEMSDVMLYLVRLADRCHVDLPSAVLSKLEQNRQKYPVDKVYGKSEKYTEYQ
ncbi:dCTP pyrophosphatase 1-like [Ylistrum balloti]|uniref:dCTP pyrophosphatase 1-like n=1 Tax=Ylistrum balloti TaxID=509963 RepID=UPI002905CB86|nr:dCTP pyrophosphatase 1-like [Ylistrum balloti]